MAGLFRELIGEAVVSQIEDRIESWTSPSIGDFALSVGCCLIIAFWYSGFADYDHYSSRGILIFALPATGVLCSILLYLVAFKAFSKVGHSLTGVVAVIGLPFGLPWIGMLWVREPNGMLVIDQMVGMGCLLSGLLALGYIVERQAEWPTWIRAVLMIALLGLAYFASTLEPAPEVDYLDKQYGPRRFLDFVFRR